MNTTIFGNARRITTRGGGVTLIASRGQHLEMEQIAAAVPSIFADEKHSSRSARYEYVDTREVLGGLIHEGFQPVEVRQGGSRDDAKRGFTKHMIRLLAPGGALSVEPRVGDITRATVVLRNSHDGTSSYQLNSGFMRLICLNGMETSDDYETFRVGHVKNARDKVIDAAFRVVNDFPRAIEGIRQMSGAQLSGGEMVAFATAARELRWPTQAERQPPVTPQQLLTARRFADNGHDLWQVMNRVQENIIRGGQSYVSRSVREIDGQRRVVQQNRTVGQVNSIDQDSAINRALWTLAEEMKKLVAA